MKTIVFLEIRAHVYHFNNVLEKHFPLFSVFQVFSIKIFAIRRGYKVFFHTLLHGFDVNEH